MHSSKASASMAIRDKTYDAAMAVCDQETRFLPDLTGDISPCAGAYPIDGGGFGSVFLAQWKRPQGTELVAVKVLRVQGVGGKEQVVKLDRRLRKELRVWKQLHHPNIVILYGTCSNFGPYAMVSPWYKNGNMSSYLKTIGPDAATVEVLFQLLCGVARGLAYLHSKKPPIVHGDVTCVNVLVDDNCQALLCDFGLSKIMESTDTSVLTSTASTGAVRCMAPELLRQYTSDDDNIVPRSECTDVYSFGCVAYEVLSGVVPYQNMRNNIQLAFKVFRGYLILHHPRGSLRDNWWTFIKTCCSERPEERPAMDEVMTTFEAFGEELIA